MATNKAKATPAEIQQRDARILGLLAEANEPRDIYNLAEQAGLEPLQVIARLRKMEDLGKVSRAGQDGAKILWAIADPNAKPSPPPEPVEPPAAVEVPVEPPALQVVEGMFEVPRTDILDLIHFGEALEVVGLRRSGDSILIDVQAPSGVATLMPV